MTTKKKIVPVSDREFAQLRRRVRTILLEHGTALAPRSQTPERIADLIGALAARCRPALSRESDALDARISDRDLAIEVSNHFGSHMAAFGDAGYFVGLSVGLELAALTCAGALGPRTKTGGRR